MKKFFFCVFAFLLFVFFDGTFVSAKSETSDNIKVSFGDEEVLNLGYSEINEFKIREDYSFYFNGIKHQFNEDYSMLDGNEIEGDTFILEGNSLLIDKENKLVKSDKKFQTYTFFASVEFLDTNTTSYEFSQFLCYKVASNQHCNEDVEDISTITSSSSFAFYYDFVPFYNKDIVFEEVSYKFTMKSKEATIDFNPIVFYKEEINYKDYFVTAGYRNVIANGDNYFMIPYVYSQDTPNLLYINAQFVHGYSSPVSRNYNLNFVVCVGETYSNCVEGETFNKTNTDTSTQSYRVALTNMYYDGESGKVYSDESKTQEIRKFLLKGKYQCVSGLGSDCNDPRASNEVSYTSEQVYEFDLQDPSDKSELNGKAFTCYQGYYQYKCYGVSGEITNKVFISDDNEIVNLYYYLGKTTVNYLEEINTPINNNEDLTIGKDLEGYHYLYYKVESATGRVNYFGPYRYLFDKSAPELTDNNFDEYNSSDSYNDINITIKYVDTYFKENNDIYFKVVSEEEYTTLTSDMIVEGYNEKVVMQDYISDDGVYRVCFKAKDYLDNYSDFNCSLPYYLDISALSKGEVNVVSNNEGYQKTLKINIEIDGVAKGVTFKCDLISVSATIQNYSELTNICNNKSETEIVINKEGSFNLWIYASDYVGNFSLLKLDQVYLIDNLAPRVSYNISGDNNIYSNNVVINVDANDINDIDSENSSYMFYLKTYNESEFIKFNLDDGITYPFDYYGSYKLAIKVCDKIDNCNLIIANNDFLIDTSKIKLSLVGEEEIVILRWGKYKELGAIANKGNGGKTPTNVDYTIIGEVNTAKSGEYYLTYVSGEGMNKIEVTRKVIVKDTVPYLLVLISLIVVGESIILLRLFIKKRKNDSI